MIYVFNIRTMPIHSEEKIEFEADCLDKAISLLRWYIRSKYSPTKVIVSYFYLCVDDDSMSLGEFTRDYYLKHFKEFQEDV